MIVGVADTHAALWHLFDDSRLSATARHFIDNAATAQQWIALSGISLVEIVYLIEKNRLPASSYSDLRSALDDPKHVLKEAPLNAGVVEAMRLVPRGSVPDMPDRIVDATAIHYEVTVISRDGRIHAAKLQTVW